MVIAGVYPGAGAGNWTSAPAGPSYQAISDALPKVAVADGAATFCRSRYTFGGTGLEGADERVGHLLVVEPDRLGLPGRLVAIESRGAATHPCHRTPSEHGLNVGVGDPGVQ